jgi:hypothetical protein
MGSSIAPPHAAVAERFRRNDAGSYVSDPTGNIMAPCSAKAGKIASLDPIFAARAGAEGLCSVCAGRFEPGAIFVFIQSTGAEPPMHVRCAFYAALACPYMRKQHEEALADGCSFDFFLCNSYNYDGDDDSPEGLFSVDEYVAVPYETFIDRARVFGRNPAATELAAFLGEAVAA